MRRTNSSPDVNTVWIDPGSVDADPFKRADLQDSIESDRDSSVQGSGEYDNAQLSFSKQLFFLFFEV